MALVFVLFSFDLVYNFAPNLKGVFTRHWDLGAVTAVGLWLPRIPRLSALPSYFSAFHRPLMARSAPVILLVWFTAFALLMAEVNSRSPKS